LEVWTGLIEALGKAYVVSGLLPLALGGVLTHFNWWIVAEQDFRRRISLLKETINESQASCLASLLTQTQSMRPIAEIRDGNGGADPVEAYVKATHAGFVVYRCLDSLRKFVRISYTTLMLTIVAALITLLIGFVFPSAKSLMAVICFCIVLIQVSIIIVLRKLATRLEENEDAI
jgi:hypothetical protein